MVSQMSHFGRKKYGKTRSAAETYQLQYLRYLRLSWFFSFIGHLAINPLCGGSGPWFDHGTFKSIRRMDLHITW